MIFNLANFIREHLICFILGISSVICIVHFIAKGVSQPLPDRDDRCDSFSYRIALGSNRLCLWWNGSSVVRQIVLNLGKFPVEIKFHFLWQSLSLIGFPSIMCFI